MTKGCTSLRACDLYHSGLFIPKGNTDPIVGTLHYFGLPTLTLQVNMPAMGDNTWAISGDCKAQGWVGNAMGYQPLLTDGGSIWYVFLFFISH